MEIIFFIVGIIAGGYGYRKFIFSPTTKSEVHYSQDPEVINEPSKEDVVEKSELKVVAEKNSSRKSLTDKQKYYAIKNAKMHSTTLLNNEEKVIYEKALKFLERWDNYDTNPDRAKSLKLFAQVSLGEFIKPKGDQNNWTWEERTAWFTLQGRRADFLITDKHFKPILVIEHQGSGHFQGDWEIRDNQKSNAYEQAGLEIVRTYCKQDNKPDHVSDPTKVGSHLAQKLNSYFGIKN